MDIPIGWFEACVGVIASGFSWFVVKQGQDLKEEMKDLSTSVHANRVKIDHIEKDLARNYHSKEELRQTLGDIMSPVRDELARLSRAVERWGNHE